MLRNYLVNSLFFARRIPVYTLAGITWRHKIKPILEVIPKERQPYFFLEDSIKLRKLSRIYLDSYIQTSNQLSHVVDNQSIERPMIEAGKPKRLSRLFFIAHQAILCYPILQGDCDMHQPTDTHRTTKDLSPEALKEYRQKLDQHFQNRKVDEALLQRAWHTAHRVATML